jgi:orotate phosphoribosyltransferase
MVDSKAPDTLAQDFVQFAVDAGVLRFGEFKTKAGRMSPYFFNAGLFDDGARMQRLAEFYAQALLHSGIEFDMIFGPAYKGIPLAATVAVELARQGRNLPFAYNRKEAKDHGEGGVLVGHRPANQERALFVEDVTTAGTSIRETVPLLHAAAAVHPAGLVVSVDRMERGRGERSALSELQDEYQMPTFAIVNVQDVMEHLFERPIDGRVVLDASTRDRMLAYRATYGAS